MDSSPVPTRPLLARFFLAPEKPKRLRTAWRLLLHFILYVISLSLLSAALLLALYVSMSEDAFYLLSITIQLIAILLTVFIARRLLDRRSFGSLGLTINRQAIWDLLTGIAISGIIMEVIFLLELAFGWLKVESFAWQLPPSAPVWGGVAIWLFAFVLVGFQEELLCRGYWLQNIADGTNVFWGVLFSSVMFAALHSENPNISWVAIVGLVFTGAFMAFGYVTTRQLWLPIGLHIGWNIFEGPIFGFQVSGLENLPRLINQTVSGPEIITGGAFGPEAGLIVLPGLALGAGLIWLYARYIKREKLEA